MSDQQNEWWNPPGAPPPPPAAVPPGADAPRPDVAPSGFPAPGADPDATVVVPAQYPGAPPINQGYGGTPAQYAPQQPPPGSQPPPYGGPQYGGPQYGAPQYGAPQFVTPAGPAGTYRAPAGSTTMIIGGLLAIIGTFLPWVTFRGDSINGYETYSIGDGFDAIEWSNPGAWVVGTMMLVIISAIVVLAVGRRVVTWVIALLAAGVGGVMVFAALGAVGSTLDTGSSRSELEVGGGMLLCLLGAFAAGVGAIIVAAKKS